MADTPTVLPSDASHATKASILHRVLSFAHGLLKLVESPEVIALLPEPERSYATALSVVDSVATAAIGGGASGTGSETASAAPTAVAPTQPAGS